MNCQEGRVLAHSMVVPIRKRSLRPNPFHAYRDPETGVWIVVLPSRSEKRTVNSSNCSDRASG